MTCNVVAFVVVQDKEAIPETGLHETLTKDIEGSIVKVK